MKKFIAALAVSIFTIGAGFLRAQDAAEKPATPATNNTAAPAETPATNPPVQTPPTETPRTNSAPATTKNIRFQFDGIPYMDVVERFAQMVNKPLITDTNVQGTLSYNDPNPYSYAEALDTLNIILSMKGVTLVETENYLRLVPFKQLPQMPIKIMRGLNYTGDVRPGEVITVVLEVKNLDAKEVADSVTPMLSNAGSMAPLSRGRGLIVTDRLQNIQRIRTLISTIDTETNIERQMRTFTLLHASGAIVADLLNRTFGIATAPKRTQYNANTKNLDVLPPDPNDYITAVYDEASRTLVLFGPDERMQLAEELINRFEQKGGPGGDVRIYYPQITKAEELANIIRQAIPGVAAPNETAASSATKARLIADTVQNRLIVAAPIPGQLDQIEQLINRVDKPVHGSPGMTNVPIRSTTVQLTRVFRPRAADATNVATILTQALTRRSSSGQIQTTASISFDPGSQSVVVSGSPGDLQIATDIISQLETGTTNPTPLATRFFDVGSVAEAKRLQPLVEQLYRNQVSDGSVGAVAHAKILSDTESGRLIVTASEDHLTRIETLIKELRGDKPAMQTRQLEIVPLNNLRVDTAVKSLNELLAEKMKDKGFADLPAPTVLADSANNRLLVTATADQLAEVRKIVEVIDIAPEKANREMRVIPLHAKTASEIIPLVTQLLEQSAEGPVSPQLAPKLLPDPSGKQIIALANSRDLERIAKFVQQFDAVVSTNIARQFRTVELFSRRAAEITPLVQQLYTEQLRGQLEPAGGPATLLADSNNNAIMVSGAEREIARVETIIRQLDPQGRRAAKEETRVIRLKSASAADLVGLVEKSLNGQQQMVRVLLDARSNSLVVSGEPSAVEAASQLITQLDARPNLQPRELRIIELKAAEASAITPMISNLFTEMLKNQRGPDYVTETKIIPDSTANRIVVTGVPDEIEQVVEIVNRLDNTPEQAPNARVFKLTSGDATVLAPIVSQAMMRYDQRGLPIRRMTVTADAKSNSLIVSGTRTDLADVASIIEKLDGEGSMKEKGLKIIDVKSDDVDALAALALKVFEAQNPNSPALVNITAEPAGKRLIVLAPINMIAQVETVISTLDSKPDQGMRELHPIELKSANAAELFPRVSQIYGEQSQGKTIKPAAIYADPTGTRFNVYGTKEQAAAIRQIVETFESQERIPRGTRVFDLGKLSEAQRVLPLAQQLYRDQLSNNPNFGPADAQFISDSRTGRIIVSAREPQLEPIAQIISSLQVTAGTNQPARETRTFEVGNAGDVQRLLPIVQQLYQDHWKDKSETDPADAQIVPDPRTGRLIVTGKPDHVKQIEALLQQIGAGKAKPEARETRVFDLSTANAMELATTVRTLYTEQSRNNPAATETLILPDASANRLIIVGDASELDAVEDIVRKLDKVSAQSASTRVFKLKFAEPDKVAEILSTALVRYDAYGRPQKRVSVVVDAKTRTIIATGDPKELQGASVIIEQLDSSLGEQPPREMKVYQVKSGRVADLVAKVRQLYQDQIKNQPELGLGDALIMEDLSSNQLILAGNEAQIALIGKIADQLQQSQTQLGQRETKLIPISQPEEVSRLLSVVQQLYQEQWRNKDASDPADAQIIPDEKNSRLIVTGRTNHIAEIEAILAQVSTPITNNTPRDTRVYDLSTSSAAELVATVRSLYTEDLKTRTAPVSGQATILPDLTANRLVVSGNTNEVTVVEDIITKLDKVSPKTGNARVFKLKNADATQVSALVSTALTRVNNFGRQIARVSIGADAANNLLIVTGEPKDLQAAEVIIEQMDSITAPENRQMRIIPIKEGAAREVATRVEALYQDQLKGKAGIGAADALIMGDDVSNRLLVTASETHLKIIEEIVTQLQEAGAGAGRQIRVIPVAGNSATSIAAMISQVFNQQITSRDSSEHLVVSALPDDRTLVVDANAPTLEKIESLIKTLDTAQADGQGIIQAVHLKKGRAEDLAVAVNASLTNRTATPGLQKVRVTPVSGGNSLLISGPQESVTEVMKIVTDLDAESTSGEIEVRIYKLENGRAKEVSSVIQQLLFNVTRQVRQDGGRFLPASVSVDDKSNSLIVSGAAAHFRVLEKLLPTLDKAPERSDRDVQFVFLRKAKAYDVVSKVSAVFEEREREDRPVIEADPLNNTITIIARRADIAQIQDLITRLDDTAKDTSMQVRLRPLESIAAEQMARMLQNIYPQMGGGSVRVVEKIANTNAPATNVTAEATITNTSPEVVIAIDRQSNALILSGPAQELDNIDRLINDLSFSFYGNEAEFRVYPLKHADPVVVARLMSELIRPEPVQVQPRPGQQVSVRQDRPRITIVPEPRTRGVIVRARPTDFALLESIIKQLDAAGELAQVAHRVVPLTNASPFRIQAMVQQMVTQMNAARPGEPVSVVPDFRSRGVLIIGRGNQIDQMEEFIRSLDTPSKTAEAEVLIVELKKASAAQVAQVLQNMVRPGTDGELTRENRELQEQIRRLKVQNDQGEAVTLDLSRPIKIDPDGAGPNAGNRIVLTSTEENLMALNAIIQMLDQPAITEGIEVQLFVLRHADATAAETTLNNIFTQGARLNVGPTGTGRGQPEGDHGKAFSAPLNVAVDQRSNTLILSGRKETLALATRLLTELDQKMDRSLTEIKLFRLKHASALRLLPLLQSVFAEGPAVPGTEGLNMQVSRLRTLRDPNAPKTSEVSKVRQALVIQADDLSNILVVSARTDTMPLIEDVIEQLDIPAASGLETVRIYPLNQADPLSMQRILNELYTGPRAANLRNEDKPVISVDPRTSALIVAGNGKSFGVIEGLLAQLDQKLPFELRDIRMIPLENSDASVLAGTLQRMMDARVTQRAALNRGEADSLKVIIIPDDRSNSLLVGGSKDSFALVESLAQQLDKANPSVAGRIRIVPLTHADARVMSSTLTTLFTQRYAAARTTDVQRNRPIIMPDPRSNSLLVAANVEDNNAIDELLKKLDQKMENPALVLTVIPLKHNDATRVTTIIETIFAARLRSQTVPGQAPLPSEGIEVQADSINNALIISASKENLGYIQELLQKIDVEPQIAGGLLQTFTLEFADAGRVASLLRSLVEQGLYRPGQAPGATARGGGRDALAVAVDPRSNTLIISASPENLAVARDIIKRLDSKDYTDATNVRLYTLKHARASSLAVTLSQFFAAKRAGDAVALNATERSIPVSVIPDDRVNSIIVTGSKDAFETVERLLAQLDGEGIFSRMNFRVFPLQKATAQKLQPVLQQIFANRAPRVRGEPLDPVTIVADAWVNALLVGATVEDMAAVESLLQKLDSEQTETGLAVHVFPLAKADARRIATTIQSLYRDNTPGVALPITVSADERINAIVVSAGQNDVQRIGELIKKLDTDQVARVSEIKVFPLKYARAETLSAILNTALNTKPIPLSDQNPNAQSVLQFITQSAEGQELVTAALKEGVLITPDARMNSLIVSGPVDYMGLLEQIIGRLDASSPQLAKIKVFTLQNADARQMAELLVGMFRMTPATANSPQRSIEYTLVRPRFDNNGVAVEEERLASATVGTAEQNALTVTVDPRTNSLLIGGTDHYVNLVSQIIESLDATPANERRTEVVRLKNSQASEVATAIRNFLDQERQRVTTVLGAEAVGTAQRLLEREVAVVAEDNSNTLLLSANPRYFDQIKQIIDELDKPQPQVLIQVLLAEVTLDSLTDLGVEWSYTGSSGEYTYGLGTDFNVKEQLASFGGYSTAVSGNDFNFLLRALKSDGRLEVLSRPQIVTADNKPASINIGQRVPLITDSRVTERGDTINSFRYEDVGVNLTVTPKISPDGFVKMEIGTTNSSISSSSVEINRSATIPIINQRRATTTVSVQSGQTIIIGGLIATLDDQRLKKVPVLGDIPYLGALFRSKTSTKDRKELLVLLTPQVLANAEGTGTIRPIDDVTREQLDKSRIKDEIKRDELQKQILDPLFPQEIFQQEALPRPKT